MNASCADCKFHLPSKTNDGGFACYRPKRMASGHIIKATANAGFAIPFEVAAANHYEGRADGDQCGPDRKHWEVMQ